MPVNFKYRAPKPNAGEYFTRWGTRKTMTGNLPPVSKRPKRPIKYAAADEKKFLDKQHKLLEDWMNRKKQKGSGRRRKRRSKSKK